MKYAIVNCDVYTGESVLYDKAIVVNEDRVDSIVDIDKIPKGLEVLDLKGGNIAPGFIDLQVNGGGGKLFSSNPSGDCVSAIYHAHKRFGTTDFLPTLISSSLDKIFKAITTVQSLMKASKHGVLGLHLEGPYLNESKATTHDRRYIRKVSTEEVDLLLAKGTGIIKLITLAPELVDESYIRRFKDSGIVVSAGHTNATYQQTIQSFKAGISSVTHLFNAMSQLGSREPGVVGAALNDDEIWAGIIVDGFHVDYSNVRLCKKIKRDRLILVTDAMPPVGSNVHSFKLGPLNIDYVNGKCVTNDNTLAGSALDMATAVRNCVQRAGIPMSEALKMASTYPSRLLGVDDYIGMIKPGYLANMVTFNDQLIVSGVFICGVYESFL